MKALNPLRPCLYFQVHQPFRLVEYDFFSIGESAHYENDPLNEAVFRKVAEKCYRPATALFQKLVAESEGRFRLTLSFSGVVLDQMERFGPDVLELFQDLVATGAVEILGETYFHSLASLFSEEEFRRQVSLHGDVIERHFGCRPRVFRNTELIYSDRIASLVREMGFRGVLAEGVPWINPQVTGNHLVAAPGCGLPLLLRNATLSDDLAFRFSDRTWSEYPLTPEKLIGWIDRFPGDLINLFMDYETIGEHQWEDTGIFEFWTEFVPLVLKQGGQFVTPSEAVAQFSIQGDYECESPTSWADHERDLSAWLGNVMQQEAALKIHALEQGVKRCRERGLLEAWSRLQTSDHFHYMSTKSGTDGAVHGYFSPFPSPYEAYIYFMNVLADLQIRVDADLAKIGGLHPSAPVAEPRR